MLDAGRALATWDLGAAFLAGRLLPAVPVLAFTCNFYRLSSPSSSLFFIIMSVRECFFFFNFFFFVFVVILPLT